MTDCIILRRDVRINQTTYYVWNRYNRVSTTIYRWNRYNVNTTTIYNWNRYNIDSQIVYKWNRYTIGTSTEYYASISDYSGNDYRYAYSSTRYANCTTDINENSFHIIELLYGDEFNIGDWFAQNSYPPIITIYHISRMDGRGTGSSGHEYRYHWIYYDKVANLSSREIDCAGDFIDTITSLNNSDYPSNGINNNYWYIYQGQETQQSQGSASGTVRSTSSSAYPNNGIQGNYWYVYSGTTTEYSQGSSNGSVTSTYRTQYPDNGRSGNYWYVYSSSSISYSQGSYIDKVTSTNRSAYPDNNYQGNYWYVYQGTSVNAGNLVAHSLVGGV